MPDCMHTGLACCVPMNIKRWHFCPLLPLTSTWSVDGHTPRLLVDGVDVGVSVRAIVDGTRAAVAQVAAAMLADMIPGEPPTVITVREPGHGVGGRGRPAVVSTTYCPWRGSMSCYWQLGMRLPLHQCPYIPPLTALRTARQRSSF